MSKSAFPRLILLSMLIASPVLAAGDASKSRIMSGESLLEDCQGAVAIADGQQPAQDLRLIAEQSTGASYCFGYLQGMYDMKALLDAEHGGPIWYCMPDSVTKLQLARIVVKWLRDHPESLHKVPLVVVVAAFRAAFPCPTEQAPAK